MRPAVLFASLALLLSACAASTPLQHDSADRPSLITLDDLIEQFQEDGLRVRSVYNDFPRLVRSGADNVYHVVVLREDNIPFMGITVYEYADAEAARYDSRRLNFGKATITRQGAPNFMGTYHPMVTQVDYPAYYQDHLIVVSQGYLGGGPLVSSYLRGIFGAPIR